MRVWDVNGYRRGSSDYSASTYYKLTAAGLATEYVGWKPQRLCIYEVNAAAFRVACRVGSAPADFSAAYGVTVDRGARGACVAFFFAEKGWTCFGVSSCGVGGGGILMYV